MKQTLKQLFLPQGRHLRRLHGGIAKGMLMRLDLHSQSQRYLGLDERELQRKLKHLIPTCKSLVDVGANDGYYTMAFLRSPAERVVACEPEAAELERLISNAEANGYHPNERFTIVQKAIGEDEDQMSIVELIHGLPPPILLKVDIEGGEYALLRGADGYPHLPDLRWLIETHSKELEDSCIGWLQEHGYETRIVNNAAWRVLLPELRPIAHNRWLVAVHMSVENPPHHL